MTKKYIFIIGGVMSGVGKGVTSASIGKILQSRGYGVTALKIDPYINVDAGTMNPVEHGEVFVTEDGDETDQDMGNYERFLNINLTSSNYMTTGRVYQSVIEKERQLYYEGKCVEVVPHIPEEVISRIKCAAQKDNADITLVEIGGTIGEYQNILFLEAARMMHLEHPDDVLFVLVSYLPIPSHIGEMKTKPTQHATRTLQSAGIHPDIIVCRGQHSLDLPRRKKLSIFCNVSAKDIISAPDVDSVYKIPLLFEEQKLSDLILEKLHLEQKPQNLHDWTHFVQKITSATKPIKIGVVGKYFGTGSYTLSDSYISVIEATKHAAWSLGYKAELSWINSEEFEQHPQKIIELSNFDGILVPGGFGKRGIEGVISSIQYARENNIPYFGLCYGMQLACIEFARNVLNLSQAHTVEIQEQTDIPIIHVNSAQTQNIQTNQYGASMRLGAYTCHIQRQTKAFNAYQKDIISERHRHRYEFNNAYRQSMQEQGMIFSGINKEHDLVEIIELANHPWFVAVQFHPEFLSRPLSPHPLFTSFLQACVNEKTPSS